MRLIQSAVFFHIGVCIVGWVIDDEINPCLMCNFQIILQPL